MADTTQRATQDTAALQRQIQGQVVSLGLLEKVQLKVHKAMVNMPILKQVLQMKQFVGGIMGAHKANTQLAQGQQNANQRGRNNLSVMQQLWVSMTAYGAATRVATKGTSGLGKAMFSLVGSMMFIFGIFLLLVLGLGLVAVAFADANSPMVQMMEDTPILSDVLSGLQIILTGEDGESGAAGAMDVFTVAAIAAAASFALFGAPIAILVGTLVATVGIFKWFKKETGSTFGAIAAATAVAAAGLYAFGAFIGGWVGTILTTVMGPIALIAGGIAGLVAVASGAMSDAKAILVGIVSAVLLAVGLIVAGVAIVPAAIIAAVALVLAIIWRFRDQIIEGITWFLGWLWAGVETVASILWTIGEVIVSAVVFIVTLPFKLIWGLLKFLFSIPGMLFNLGKKIGEATVKPFLDLVATVKSIGAGLKDKFMSGVNWFLNLPNTIIAGVKAGMAAFDNAFRGFWNQYISQTWTVPRFIMKLTGLPRKLNFPPEMADGGIVSGPKSGYPATLHGTEAVVPLPDGRSIPVTMKGGTGGGGHTFNINVDASGIAILSHQQKMSFAKEIGNLIKDEINKSSPF